MPRNHIYIGIIILFVFFFSKDSFAQTSKKQLVISGLVVDKNNKPIEFATAKLEDPALVTYTDTAGRFSFSFYGQPGVTKISISFVGKRTIEQTTDLNFAKKPLIFNMSDLSLTLDDVQVIGVRRGEASNSSVLFNREAIEQTQAFSLADVLNNLPGQRTVAPGLQSPKNITLRSEATEAHSLNNAMGTAIIMDGVRLSNDANMQNTNVGKSGMAGSVISGKSGIADVAFGGIDLREIPADNIESVEVVSGVASAQYSELTDGAVIINRQAGKTNYQVSTRVNGASFNTSLSKGYTLGKKAGALNVSLNYLYSLDNPSDNLKSYKRVSTELMWTNAPTKGVKQTFSATYNTRLDNMKNDPDEGQERSMFAKSRNIRLSERISIQLNNNWINSIRMNLSYSRGYQETYSQWWLNGYVKPMATKDTTGIYEGYYLPGTYYAREHVRGIPVNISANIAFISNLNTGNILHSINWGASLSQAANYGEGVIADPYSPRLPNGGSQNERPYEYKTIPEVPSYGFYLEDHFKLPLLGRNIHMNAGIRYDIQNRWGSIQPRINARYQLNRRLELNIAYGISRKAPAMAHRYPGPTFYDILLINQYTGDTRTSLALFYTEKFTPDNSHLKSNSSSQLEAGLRFSGGFINSSIFVYYKNNQNGFSGVTTFRPFQLPIYETIYNGPTAKPSYYATGEMQKRGGLRETQIQNVLQSKNLGAEWMLSTQKIKTIQTSFDLSTSFAFSDSYDGVQKIWPASEDRIALGQKAWYGIYPPIRSKNFSMMSKLNCVTHISKLGLAVNLSADVFWLQQIHNIGQSDYPFAWLDEALNYHAIDKFNTADPDYGGLALVTEKDGLSNQPFIYSTLSLRISKEVKKNIRFSFNAYNFLNIQPKYSSISGSITTYGSPVSVGAELSIKF